MFDLDVVQQLFFIAFLLTISVVGVFLVFRDED